MQQLDLYAVQVQVYIAHKYCYPKKTLYLHTKYFALLLLYAFGVFALALAANFVKIKTKNKHLHSSLWPYVCCVLPFSPISMVLLTCQAMFLVASSDTLCSVYPPLNIWINTIFLKYKIPPICSGLSIAVWVSFCYCCCANSGSHKCLKLCRHAAQSGSLCVMKTNLVHIFVFLFFVSVSFSLMKILKNICYAMCVLLLSMTVSIRFVQTNFCFYVALS